MAALAWILLTVPAVFVFIRGRQLLPRKGEATFPELHFKKAQTSGLVLGGCLGVVLVQAPDFYLLKMGWLLLGVAVADYPYRKALHGFSQGLLPDLSFQIRIAMALHGHLLLLICIPGFVELWLKASPRYGLGGAGLDGGLGGGALAVAVTVALLSILAMHFVPWRFKWFVRARPLMQPQLDSHFFGIVQGATCRVPEIRHFGPKGGFYLNAHALPSLYRPLVVLSDDLLSTLGPREVGAVFAHELAHLEEATRRRRILDELGFVTLATLGVLAVWGTSRFSPGLLPYLAWAWPMLLILGRNWVATSQQRQEHRSDLRAVELSGDAQTTIDALNKIHLFNYLPRRWSGDDSALSHPSLANRLRAIQEASAPSDSPPPPPPPVQDVVVRGIEEPSTVVVLGSDRLSWLNGVSMQAGRDPKAAYDLAPQRFTVMYTELADLRLVAKGQNLWLSARAADGERRLRLSDQDASTVKLHLERIDHLLQGTARENMPVASGDGTKTGHLRLNGFLVALLGLFSTWTWPLFLAGLLVAIAPSTTALAAAGTLAIGSQVVALARGEVSVGLDLAQNGALLNVLCLTFMGILFFNTAMRRYRVRAQEAGWTLGLPFFVLGPLALLSLLWGLLRFSIPSPHWFLHLWAREMPFLLPAALALAVALCFLRRPWARPAAVGMGLIAGAVALLGSSWARHHVVQDPLAALGPRIQLSDAVVELEPVRSLQQEGWPGLVRWSPSGARLARQIFDTEFEDFGADLPEDAAEAEYDETEYRETEYHEDLFEDGFPFVVELGSGQQMRLDAPDLLWLDDDHLLLLSHAGEQTLLSSLSLVPSTEEPMQVTMPRLVMPTVQGSETPGSWHVVGLEKDASVDVEGEDREPQVVLSWRGQWPGGEVERQQLVLPDDPSAYYEWFMGVDGALLKQQSLEDWSGIPWKMLFLGFFDYLGQRELSWKSMDGLGGRHTVWWSTVLGTECLPAPSPSQPVLCWVDDGRFTSFWTMGSEPSEVQVLGHVDCSLIEVFYNRDGVFVNLDDEEVWHLDLASASGRRYRLATAVGDEIDGSGPDQEGEESADGEAPGFLESFLEDQFEVWYSTNSMTLEGRHVTLTSSVSGLDGETVDIELFRLPIEETQPASDSP